MDFFRRLAHEVPWSAALCATALLEEEVVEIARTVGKALVEHYGVRPEWGGANYTVHEAVEAEESGETKATILKHLKTPEIAGPQSPRCGRCTTSSRSTRPGSTRHWLD